MRPLRGTLLLVVTTVAGLSGAGAAVAAPAEASGGRCRTVSVADANAWLDGAVAATTAAQAPGSSYRIRHADDDVVFEQGEYDPIGLREHLLARDDDGRVSSEIVSTTRYFYLGASHLTDGRAALRAAHAGDRRWVRLDNEDGEPGEFYPSDHVRRPGEDTVTPVRRCGHRDGSVTWSWADASGTSDDGTALREQTFDASRRLVRLHEDSGWPVRPEWVYDFGYGRQRIDVPRDRDCVSWDRYRTGLDLLHAPAVLRTVVDEAVAAVQASPGDHPVADLRAELRRRAASVGLDVLTPSVDDVRNGARVFVVDPWTHHRIGWSVVRHDGRFVVRPLHR